MRVIGVNDVFLAFHVYRKMNVEKSIPSIQIDMTFDLLTVPISNYGFFE